MSFEKEYRQFISSQAAGRTGEGLRRIEEGHGYLERLFLQQVWWPVIGSFDDLHAEYEVNDFREGTRFLDFAFLRPPYRICLELDGYGPHLKEISRWQFADQLQRQNHLILEGWKLFRFASDDVKDRPDRCQRVLQQIMGKYYGSSTPLTLLTGSEKRLLQLFIHQGCVISPRQASVHMQMNEDHTRRMLQRLTSLGLLSPASGRHRIRSYKLNGQAGRLLE